MNVLTQDNINTWTSLPTTGAWVTNTTYTGLYRRVGDCLEGQIKISLSGAPTSANLTINLPNSYTIDTSKLVDTTSSNQQVGHCSIVDSGTATYQGVVLYDSSSTLLIAYSDDASAAVTRTTVTQLLPITFGASDSIIISFTVPITQFAGSQSSLVGFSGATNRNMGLITSYSPSVLNSIKSVNSSDYTILDNDCYDTIMVVAGAANRTVTLPLAANNSGRRITVTKVDTGSTYNVIIDGNGSETIDGNLTVTIRAGYRSVTVVSNGTSWFSTGISGDSLLPPIGSIMAWHGGYNTTSSNGGYTYQLGSANTIAAINTYIGECWRVCDGTALNDVNSPIFNGASRYLPNISDSRFVQGGTTVGGQAGSNTQSTTTNKNQWNSGQTSWGSHSHDDGTLYACLHMDYVANRYYNLAVTGVSGWNGNRLGDDATLISSSADSPHTEATQIGGDTGTTSLTATWNSGNANIDSWDNRPSYVNVVYIMRVK